MGNKEINIPLKLYREIQDYCNVNQIVNIDKFMEKMLKKGFDIEKWGDINFTPEEQTQENIPPTPVIINKTEPTPIQQPKKEEVKPIKKDIKIKQTDNQEDNDIYGDE